ncbi:hypothetical protein H7J88_18995 [Mycolicibacterium flavescens]|uniref:Alkylphosphonate uptake protein n=1 Tax=Mycolicibacterium flavescens TaxID=1776 RepID=A0A1E3RLY6_MYCFV|nr:hypothetical protein [Mycolicibacterium flavescens]MCV7281719.1 hypothetical protein [Mycolicibacterium flavescens]ODQ90881.1 hypothetical protein BHQ18_09220 [Mycolicibacterium flavescens]
MTQTEIERLHIVVGSDWKDAVITLLEDRSSYRPWRSGFGEAHIGDPVAIVLNTDPPSVMTRLGRIGSDGCFNRAEITWGLPSPGLVDLGTLAKVVGLAREQDPRHAWQLRGDAATRMRLALTDCDGGSARDARLGHSTTAAAATLLHSRGRCTGCGAVLDLIGDDARNAFRIRTVDYPERERPEVVIMEPTNVPSYYFGPIPDKCWLPKLPADWPGVLCPRCDTAMADGGFTSLIDYVFSQHPRCPFCGAQRTQSAQFGHTFHLDFPPWDNYRGCARGRGDDWTCTVCGSQW